MFDCLGSQGGEGSGDGCTQFADVLGGRGVDVSEQAECEARFFWMFGGLVKIIRR